MNFKKWIRSIQTAGYNGARTVFRISIYCVFTEYSGNNHILRKWRKILWKQVNTNLKMLLQKLFRLIVIFFCWNWAVVISFVSQKFGKWFSDLIFLHNQISTMKCSRIWLDTIFFGHLSDNRRFCLKCAPITKSQTCII